MTTDEKLPSGGSVPEETVAQVAGSQVLLPNTDVLQSLPVGQAFQMPVFMTPGMPRVFADDLVVSMSHSGFVDLTAVAYHQNYAARQFTVKTRTDDGVELEGSQFLGSPVIIEEAHVRMTLQTAINLAGAIVENAKKTNSLTDDQLQQVIDRITNA